MSKRWISMVLVFVAALLAGTALAQDPGRFRLQDALDLTDQRIQLASSLVAESANAPAAAVSEMATARDIQARARSAFSANQPLIALRATLDARAHADRAVAIVRGLPDPDRVTVQVERTRDVLDRARDRLQACDNLRARGMLKVAMDMQQRAESRLDQSMYLGALQLTMSARERVQNAMRLCNLNESLSDSADRALQRTDEVLARAQDGLGADSPQALRDALSRAQSIQANARAEAHLEHYDAALRLTQDARMMAQRANRSGRAERRRMR